MVDVEYCNFDLRLRRLWKLKNYRFAAVCWTAAVDSQEKPVEVAEEVDAAGIKTHYSADY